MLRSATRYSIHSPFLYDLVENVIRNGHISPGVRAVEDLRRKCLSSEEVILKTDYGKRGEDKGLAIYPVSIASIARKSLMRRRHAVRLHNLARHLKATSILELGTSLGLTTAYMALANPGSQVLSLEGCPELCKRARVNLDVLGIKNAEVVEGKFEEQLEGTLARLGKVDLLLIDGDHRKESLLANLERCYPFLHNDSVVIIDDIHQDPEMEEAWEMVFRREEIRISLDFYFMGWLFFRKESSKEHFRLRYL
jgi:predicted O-methyltransferase YrrM